MAVGLDLSVLAGRDVLDLAELVAALSSRPLPADLQIQVVGASVRVQAQRHTVLGEVADPLVGWWLAHRPDAVLRLAAAGGELRITSRAGDSAADIVRHFITHESGPIPAPDGAADHDGEPTRHGRARVVRGFTARVVGASRDDGILSVGVAEDPAGTGRSLVLQGVDPIFGSVGLIDLDEEPYCVVTETAATVYGGLKAIALRDGTLRLQFTRTAAKTLGVARTLTIGLDVDSAAIADLRNGIREVLAHARRPSAPTLNLD